MMTASELATWQRKCEARIEDCFLIAEKHFNRDIPRPRVEWSTQQKRTAGTAMSSWGGMPVCIKLSLQILSLNGQEFCDRTPGHEAAHLIQAYIDGRSDGHGYRWKQVMRLIGQEASRCHSMATMASIEGGRHFKCACQVHVIGASRKKTILGIARGTVSCRKCREKLVEISAPASSESQQKMQMARAAKDAIKAVASGKVTAPSVKKVAVKKTHVKAAPAKKVVGSTRKFADVVREVLDANPKKSYEQIVALLVKIEPNKSKCRCYARDFMIKRGTYKN